MISSTLLPPSTLHHPSTWPHHHVVSLRPTTIPRRTYTLLCSKTNPTSKTSIKEDPKSETNLLLKAAWYTSELLGIAASLIKSPSTSSDEERDLGDWSGIVDRAQVAETIKEDFKQSYFVTGKVTLGAYEEECEFADPAGSFRGVRRFKRNCSNFGLLVDKSDMKLTKWEDLEDKGVGHWRFSCILSFPWKPILSATGYTEYYFDPQTGRVCRHEEHWNVPKMALLKQILQPSKGFWGSFRGVHHFKRNCLNFGHLVEKNWKDLEDKGIGHCCFSCNSSFPGSKFFLLQDIQSIISIQSSGRVCRY